MVTHVVIFTWRAGVTSEQIDAFADAMSRMATGFSETATIRHGRDLAYRPGNGDYAMIATFEDRAGWDAYQAHPTHKAFVREFAAPLQASRLTIQL